MPTTIQINGQARPVQATPDTPLLWVLRGELQLTGTKFGCGAAQCGACTVQVDGQPTRACVTPLAAVAQRLVTTIEGLQGREIAALRAAWTALDVVQCGYCQSGQLVAAAALLKATPQPDDAQIDAAMDGNLCRCGSYPRIRAAIHQAAQALAAAPAATSTSA